MSKLSALRYPYCFIEFHESYRILSSFISRQVLDITRALVSYVKFRKCLVIWGSFEIGNLARGSSESCFLTSIHALGLKISITTSRNISGDTIFHLLVRRSSNNHTLLSAVVTKTIDNNDIFLIVKAIFW